MPVRHETSRGAARQAAIAIAAAVLIAVVSALILYHTVDSRWEAVNRTLTRYRIADCASSAALYARQGQYEKAREQASSFFTQLSTQLDSGKAFTDDQKNRLRPLLAQRDDVITLLARSDPASVDRLFQLELAYRNLAGALG